MFTGHVILDVFHRARTIQRDNGDDILEPVGLEAAQHITHTTRFKLEHANRVTLRQHLEGLGIIKRNVRQINFDAALDN